MSLDLQAIEEIKQLKYRYVRALDTADIETLVACFTETADVRFEGGIYTVAHTGREAIATMVRTSFHSKAASAHQLHHPTIEVLSETTARGQWSLQDVFHDLNMRLIVSGAAEYIDDYVREADGQWRITKSGYKRLYELTQPMPENMTCTYNLLAETGQDLALGG